METFYQYFSVVFSSHLISLATPNATKKVKQSDQTKNCTRKMWWVVGNRCWFFSWVVFSGVMLCVWVRCCRRSSPVLLVVTGRWSCIPPRGSNNAIRFPPLVTMIHLPLPGPNVSSSSCLVLTNQHSSPQYYPVDTMLHPLSPVMMYVFTFLVSDKGCSITDYIVARGMMRCECSRRRQSSMVEYVREK